MASRREITKLLGLSALAAAAPASVAWAAREDSPIVARVAPPGSMAETLWRKFDDRLIAANGAGPRLAAAEDRASDPAIFAAIQAGRAHLGAVLVQSIAPQIPALATLRLPYLFGDEARTIRAFDHKLLALIQPYLDPFSVVALGWIESGWLQVYGGKPLLEPEQLKGLRLRRSAGDNLACLAQGTGAHVVDIPYREIGAAMADGRMAGGEFTPLELISGPAVVAAAPHLTLTSHGYSAGLILAHKPWFDGMARTQRRRMQSMVPSYAESRDIFGRKATEFVAARRALGMAHDLSAAQRDHWRHALQATHGPALDRIGPEAKALYARLRRL